MNKKTRQIGLNAFTKNTVGHQRAGLWRYPGDRTLHYKDIKYWQDLARISEEGLFDAVFIADALGVHDVYRGNDIGALRTAMQVPVNDPLTIATIGAAVTRHVGFGITAGVFFEHPFPFARRLSTLDHLTGGRVAWNIVTGYMPSANRNMGLKILPHDERYDYADEYMEVIYKLLEGSWEDDAVILDRETGQFADPAKIHHIGHHGRYFDVPGTHLCEPSIQRTPLLFQAGNSERGRRFAATHAEAVFIGPPSKEHARELSRLIREEAVKQGRDPRSVKIYGLAFVVTDRTQKLAEAKYEDLNKYLSQEGVLVSNSAWLGADLSKLGLDEPIDSLEGNSMILSHINALSDSRTTDGRKWTLRDILGKEGGGPRVVGSGEQVAKWLIDYAEYADIDGFNLSIGTVPGTFEDVVRYVVPELQKLGAYKLEYAEGSLRNKLFGRGDRLPDEHIGSQYRVGGPRSTIDDYAESTGRRNTAGSQAATI